MVHFRTFRSSVDGSVQPYAVRPAVASEELAGAASPPQFNGTRQLGLVLSLHGAAVTCESQIDQYEARDWAHIIAPTGRRPYGFDWEDWGRIDALEALADAENHYAWDPTATYLT